VALPPQAVKANVGRRLAEGPEPGCLLGPKISI